MRPLGWPGIVRLGLVQSAIGALAVLATSLLNRVMVVEYALPAAIPGALVAWHYAVQLSRPAWGHGSDRGRRRVPWILGGMAVLATGTLLAVASLKPIAGGEIWGISLAIAAFTLIGAGVGAAGTTLLALLAVRVAPERRAAAAALTWTMMVAGIAATAGVVGALVDPFSPARLMAMASGVAAVALIVTLLATWRVEAPVVEAPGRPGQPLRIAVAGAFADPVVRRFTAFVFVSMLAFSMQDLILEPFAGLRFSMTPGESTQLTGMQHAGMLAGMIAAGIGGRRVAPRALVAGGCAASALAITGLALASQAGPGWPIAANVALLGLSNGMFAVAAIGAMMALAAQDRGHEGVRMGLWGAAQAVAFGLGGLIGAVGVDAVRALTGSVPVAFAIVFTVEGLLFLAAAMLATGRVVRPQSSAVLEPA